MLVIVGEGKVRNSSVAVQDARGAHRHWIRDNEQGNMVEKRELTPSQYSIVTAGPIDRSRGLNVAGSSTSSSCFAEVDLDCAGTSGATLSGRQSIQARSGVGTSAIVIFLSDEGSYGRSSPRGSHAGQMSNQPSVEIIYYSSFLVSRIASDAFDASLNEWNGSPSQLPPIVLDENLPEPAAPSPHFLTTIMSSPYPRRPGSGIALTSPASSQNGGFQSSPNRTGNGGGSLPSQQPILDPLALDATTRQRLAGQRGADEAEDEDMVPRRRRARNAEVTEYNDVPRVRDVTAEKVMESFAMFLEKLVVIWD